LSVLVVRGQKARSDVFAPADPRIHLQKMMDCRVTPGNDEENNKGETYG
jgi:hypothetical protein